MPALYLDNDVTVRAAPLLIAANHTAYTTAQLNRRTASDYDQLLYAAQKRWVLVTHNWGDFQMLHGAWHLWSRAWRVEPAHSGILVLEHGPEHDIASAVIRFFSARSLADVENTLWRHIAATGWVQWTRI